MNMALPMNAVLFQRQGLARLKALLEEVSFAKTVKVLPQSKHDWDAELDVRTAAGATRLLVDCKRRSEPRFLREPLRGLTWRASGIPGSALRRGAGALFGVAWGSVYVSVGSTLGATSAFFVGRYLARNAIARKIEGSERFAAIDKAVANEGWKIVDLTWLSPVFRFTGENRVG